MKYHDSNPVIYQQHICFRSIKSLMAAQLNIRGGEIPFSPPQLDLRWRMLVAQVDEDSESEQGMSKVWEDRKVNR